jgi:hypothetical protein
MRRQQNLPGQLTLNFECNNTYLGWLELKGEKYDEYEAATQKFFTATDREEQNSPIWHEIVYALNR